MIFQPPLDHRVKIREFLIHYDKYEPLKVAINEIFEITKKIQYGMNSTDIKTIIEHYLKTNLPETDSIIQYYGLSHLFIGLHDQFFLLEDFKYERECETEYDDVELNNPNYFFNIKLKKEYKHLSKIIVK
jgi:hypothetical protein